MGVAGSGPLRAVAATPSGWSSWSSTAPSSDCSAAAAGCPGPMTTSRTGHTATLLSGPACTAAAPPAWCGEVLVAGGDATGLTAELYNPATGQWTATGNLNTPRSKHSATLLLGPACQGSAPPSYCGKVLVAGGISAGGQVTPSAELYDPASGTWTATGSMLVGSWGVTAVLLTGPACSVAPIPTWCGKVLVASQLYDPAAGTWSFTGAMTASRSDATTTVLDGPQCSASPAPAWCGRVLAAGGHNAANNSTGFASAEVYDPASGTWSATGSMSAPRFQHTATLLGGAACAQQPAPSYCGSVLVAGGWTSNFNPDPNAELYNPATGAWSSSGALITPRANHGAALLADGRVLVAGGTNDAPTQAANLTSAELYNPNTGAWVGTGSLLNTRGSFPLVQLASGAVLAVGPGTSVEQYTPANPAVTLSSSSLAYPRALVGSASPPQTVTVTNAGTVALTVSAATIVGADPQDFAVSANGCSGTSVAPGASCTISVVFTPTAPAARAAQLAIADNAGGSPQSVALSGTAESALLAVTGIDGQLWTRQDSQPFVSFGGQLVGAPAVVAMPGSSGTVPTPLFLGIGTDRNVYVRTATKAWQPLSTTPVACIDSLGALVTTSSGTQTLTVACEGTDAALYYAQATLVSSALPVVTRWTNLGGVLSAGPAVAAPGGRVTFYVVGSNGLVYVRDTTSNYVAMSYRCQGHPAVAIQGSNQYFACDGSDGALWYAINTGVGWPAATSAGGVVTGGPGIAAATNQAELYAEGSNGGVYHIVLTPGGTATAYLSDGGGVQGGTAAAGLVP